MAEQSKVFYCAYSDARRIAAQHRNYGNCLECKKAHQKCRVTKMGACERCIKLKKTCSLSDELNLVDACPTMGAGLSGIDSDRPIQEEELQRFGNIVYVIPCGNEPFFDVIHVRIGRDRHDQAYSTKCDRHGSRYEPIGPPQYLGPWTEVRSKFEASLYSLRLEDMGTVW